MKMKSGEERVLYLNKFSLNTEENLKERELPFSTLIVYLIGITMYWLLFNLKVLLSLIQ